MIATSIEQSKKLLELGLSKESADMLYQCVGFTIHATEGYKDFRYRLRTLEDAEHKYADEFDVTAWSLSALLRLLPFPVLWQEMLAGMIGWKCKVTILEDETTHTSPLQDTEIDAVLDCIVWLIETNYLC